MRRRRTEKSDRKEDPDELKTLCISCTKDEGRPFGVGFQEQASNHSKLLRSRAVVVSVGVRARGDTPGRWESGRRTQVNLCRLVETNICAVETRGVSDLWDRSVGNLATGQAAAGVEEA